MNLGEGMNLKIFQIMAVALEKYHLYDLCNNMTNFQGFFSKERNNLVPTFEWIILNSKLNQITKHLLLNMKLAPCAN